MSTGCNDCTDYVSQALSYGGFSTDSTWYPSEYNPNWIRPYELAVYFDTTINKADFVSELSFLQPGDLAFIYQYLYAEDRLNWLHVVMVSGVNPHRYSAHTYDRYNYPFNSDFNRFLSISYTPPPTSWKIVFLPIIKTEYSSTSTTTDILQNSAYPASNEIFGFSTLEAYPSPLP